MQPPSLPTLTGQSLSWLTSRNIACAMPGTKGLRLGWKKEPRGSPPKRCTNPPSSWLSPALIASGAEHSQSQRTVHASQVTDVYSDGWRHDGQLRLAYISYLQQRALSQMLQSTSLVQASQSSPANQCPVSTLLGLIMDSTSDETRNPQPVNKGVVKLVAAGKELSHHVQVGSDCPGSSQHCLEHNIWNITMGSCCEDFCWTRH